MTIAYLVVSHHDPQQVLRLVRVLREGPSSEVVVRHDLRSSWLDAVAVEDAGGRLLHDGMDIEWGSSSYLGVLLHGLEWVDSRLDADWTVVLSGQDYPLRPLAEVESFLANTRHDALLGSMWRLDTSRRPAPPAEDFFLRYLYAHYALPSALGRRLLERAPRRLAYVRELPPLGTRLGVRCLRPPFGPSLRCHVSSDWVTLSRRALRAVIGFARRERRVMRHYRRTIIPTESFFATALMNEPGLRVGTEPHRYARFGRDKVHPDVLRGADLDELLASGAHFARKFDTAVDAEVLDELDARRTATGTTERSR